MNPKKQKIKDRRRARKLADQAWEAADAGNLDLAEKIIRRAVAAQPDNPVLWDDQGVVFGLRHKEAEASESFRTAISLAPTFAEPYAHLAAQRIRQGFVKEAVALQTQAVKHAPQNVSYVERLEAYRALANQGDTQSVMPHFAGERTLASSNQQIALPADEPCDDWPERLATLDWRQLRDRLTCEGCVVIKELVDAETCARLRGKFADDALFAKSVVMDRPEFG